MAMEAAGGPAPLAVCTLLCLSLPRVSMEAAALQALTLGRRGVSAVLWVHWPNNTSHPKNKDF